ncbi:T9SS type A sorting domain-containing protein [Nonlabens xiamenensis]|uniref:T9SS type A sorting domain-containing protein n=1 Tax=Nonlabens xiamenensis TaxID=2341043 RepID=UPI000F6051CC|nr:T9SS type A sorting domain-containing protein [Nonlabens xiamenensis]
MKIKRILFFTTSVLFIGAGFWHCSPDTTMEDAQALHREFVLNSAVHKSLSMSKEERKAHGLPPNAYNERMWELTMNPRLGYPTPFKVQPVETNSIGKSVPGSGARAWEERGPNNVGGRTRVVFYDPNDVGANNGDGIDYNRVFAGGVGGGLWVNDDITDPNEQWTIVPGVAANLSVQSYAIDPLNPQNIYIGTGEQYTGGAAIGDGLYKSSDGGNTWAAVPVPFAGPGDASTGTNLFKAGIFCINDVVVWDNNGNAEIYIGVGSILYNSPNFNISNPVGVLGTQNTGIYKSIDDGSTWSRVESPILSYNFSGQTFYVSPNDFEISADNTLYMSTINSAGTGQGGGRVYRSTDGVSWSLRNVIPGANRVEIAASGQDANKFYIAAQVLSAGDLFVTDDAFASVTPINEPNDADNSIPSTDFTRGQAFYDLVIETDPTNDQIVYVGGIDSFRSVNGGTSYSQISKWMNGNGLQTINAPFVHADIHAISFKPGNPNEGLIGSDGGVSWAQSFNQANTNSSAILTRNNGYNVTQFYYGSIAALGQANGDDLAGGTQDNGTLAVNDATPGENAFGTVLGGDGGYVAIDEVDNYAVITSQFNNHRNVTYPTYNFRYCISTPNCGDGGNNPDGDFINVAELDANLDYFFSNSRNFNGTNAIEACQLFSGASACTLLSNSLISSSRPTALKVSPYTTTSTSLFIGTEFSKLVKVENANTTNPVWLDISDPNFLGSVSDIEFGASEQEIYLTMHNYGVNNIWYTNDGGTTWEPKDGNLPDIPVKTILANPLLPGEVMIGTELGIYATSDFANTNPAWQPLINGMTNVKVVDLDLRLSDNTILATTHGRGMFTGKFDTLGIAFAEAETTEISVYPTISDGVFQLAASSTLGEANIRVFDLSGREVSNQLSSISATPIRIEIYGPSGMYLIRIQKEGFVQTQKVIKR